MASYRKHRKLRKTRCRTKTGRFKKCKCGDRHYSVPQRKRRSRVRRRSRRRSKYLYRCRSRSGSFKRCRYCDHRSRLRKRSRS